MFIFILPNLTGVRSRIAKLPIKQGLPKAGTGMPEITVTVERSETKADGSNTTTNAVITIPLQSNDMASSAPALRTEVRVRGRVPLVPLLLTFGGPSCAFLRRGRGLLSSVFCVARALVLASSCAKAEHRGEGGGTWLQRCARALVRLRPRTHCVCTAYIVLIVRAIFNPCLRVRRRPLTQPHKHTLLCFRAAAWARAHQRRVCPLVAVVVHRLRSPLRDKSQARLDSAKRSAARTSGPAVIETGAAVSLRATPAPRRILCVPRHTGRSCGAAGLEQD